MELVQRRTRCDGRRQIGVVIQGRKRPRRCIGRVGPGLADMGEPGRLLLLHPAQEPLGEEGRHAVLGRPQGLGLQHDIPVGDDVVAQISKPVIPGLGIVWLQLEAHRKARQDALIGQQSGVVRAVGLTGIDALVGITEQDWVIAGPAGGQGQVVEAGVKGRAIGHHPMVHLVHAGIEARTTRAARRGLAIVPREPHALRGEPIKIGCPHHRMTRAGQAVPTELVEGDEQDVQAGAPTALDQT